MKLFPIVFLLTVVCLAAAAGETFGEICHPPRTPTKLIARRTWPSQTATTTTTAKPTTTTTTTTTTPLLILINCSVSGQDCGTICPNATSAGTGVVQSPNFPADYGNAEKSCRVAIIAPVGKRIQLTFTKFNLETGHAYVLGYDDQDTIYIVWATGSANPGVITTDFNTLYIQFHSDGSTTHHADIYYWRATYTAI